MTLSREELWEKYGQGTMLKEPRPNHVSFAFDNEEAAKAYAQANNEHYGYPSWVEERPEGWVNVIDLTEHIASLKATSDD